jgi:hypothetical protein
VVSTVFIGATIGELIPLKRDALDGYFRWRRGESLYLDPVLVFLVIKAVKRL